MTLSFDPPVRGHRRLLDRAASYARVYRWAGRAMPKLFEMANPRGRCDRKAFLHIALAFLAVQTSAATALWLCGLELSETGALVSNAPVVWIGTTVCIKRLHDVGRCGWWIPGAFAFWFAAAMVVALVASMVSGPEALEPGRPLFFVVFAAITLPAFGALLWLHTAPSVAVANEYGPLPAGMGLSMPSRDATVSSLARSFHGGSVLA